MGLTMATTMLLLVAALAPPLAAEVAFRATHGNALFANGTVLDATNHSQRSKAPTQARRSLLDDVCGGSGFEADGSGAIDADIPQELRDSGGHQPQRIRNEHRLVHLLNTFFNASRWVSNDAGEAEDFQGVVPEKQAWDLSGTYDTGNTEDGNGRGGGDVGDDDAATDKFNPNNDLSASRGVHVHHSSWDHIAATLKSASSSVSSSGAVFSFCAVGARDEWACDGAAYVQTLRNTTQFNASSFERTVCPGSVIVGDGSGPFAQLWAPVLCLPSVRVWKVDGASSNSYVAYAPDMDVLLLLLDNDPFYGGGGVRGMKHSNNTWKFLARHRMRPTVATMGFHSTHGQKDLSASATKLLRRYHEHFAGTCA